VHRLYYIVIRSGRCFFTNSIKASREKRLEKSFSGTPLALSHVLMSVDVIPRSSSSAIASNELLNEWERVTPMVIGASGRVLSCDLLA